MERDNMKLVAEIQSNMEKFLKLLTNEKVSNPIKTTSEVGNDSIHFMNDTNAYYVTTNSIYFLDSKVDAKSVDVILENFKEFSNFCSDNNFILSVQADKLHGPTVIRLNQTAESSNRRKFFSELENLIRKKTSNNDGLDCNLAELDAKWEQKFESFKKSLEEERRKEMDNMKEESKKSDEKWERKFSKEADTLKTSLDTYKKKFETVDKLLKQEEMKKEMLKKKPVDKFLQETTLASMKDCPGLVDKICMKLSEEIDYLFMQSTPLEDIPSMDEKRKIVHEYLDSLQSRKTAVSNTSASISSFFSMCPKNFFTHNPTDAEKMLAKTEIKEKFDLDKVVGTIHTIDTGISTGSGTLKLYLGIVNKKIVSMICTSCKREALSLIRSDLKLTFKWPMDSRLATTYPVKEKHADILVQNENIELYKENEKVVTWIENNWKKVMPSFQYTDRTSDFPALYSIAVAYFEETST